MSRVNPVSSTNIGFSALTTNRSGADNAHYVASRINDLYNQALNRQAISFAGTRSLRRFIDANSKDGKKLHKIV